MKFLKVIFMGFWSVVFGFKKALAKDNAPKKQAVFLKGRHAQMYMAARRGNVDAQLELATCYSEGDGVEQNYTEAAHWFGEAAKLDDPRGQFSFGICCANGQGVAQDYEEAAEWFRKAAEQRIPGAQVSLGICLQKGLGVYASPREAVHWFRQAAEVGDAAGELSLACCLQSGSGVDKNEAEALAWFRKAAAQGVAEADFNVGKCFQNGSGVAANDEEAFKYFQTAAKKGLPQAEMELGLCFWHGRGTAADLPEAFAWLHLAARRAIPEARENCESLEAEMTPEQLEEGKARLERLSPAGAHLSPEKVELEPAAAREISDGVSLPRSMKAAGLMALIGLAGLAFLPDAAALERTNTVFKIFQFPPDRIPTIDGQTNDWDIVPEDYVVGMNQLTDDSGKHAKPDPKNLDVRVRVGWVKGLNRLYFLYEAYDDYWDFADPGLHNDTFELVVDGDLSGGPLIERFSPAKSILGEWETYYSLQGTQAQNYHIFTPAEGKDWCMVWGPAHWLKELPYANAAYAYHFRPGQAGRLTLEFWITPFDYAGAEGPQRAVESVLRENKIIGLCWAVIDYDDVHSGTTNNGFWNLSPKHTMYGNASELVAFRLMPLEPQFRKPIEAQWSFQVVDMDRRLVAFKDLSVGTVTNWNWDFGDGETSSEQHPLHRYKEAGHYVVVLVVQGPAGQSRRSKVWDVMVK